MTNLVRVDEQFEWERNLPQRGNVTYTQHLWLDSPEVARYEPEAVWHKRLA